MQQGANEELKRLLIEGKSLIEARKILKSQGIDATSNIGFLSINLDHYADDYFSLEKEGEEYFTAAKLNNYSRLPSVGIILNSGTIFKARSFHIELACWLKLNGVNLKNSLRYVYFPDSKRMSFVEGYDFSEETDENDVLKLLDKWNDFYDGELLDYDLPLTEPQAYAICKLADVFKLDRNSVFEYNEGFRMSEVWQDDHEKRKIGRDNWKTVDYALKKYAENGSFNR